MIVTAAPTERGAPRDRGVVAGRTADADRPGSPGPRRQPAGAPVDEFVETLPAASHRLLEYLAVADPLPLADAVALAGRDAVDEAVRAGAVVVDGDRLRPAHPLFVDAVRDALGGPDLRRLRTELVDRLAAVRRRAVWWGGCAERYWRSTATVRNRWPSCAAAQDALRLGDLELSERLGQAALGREPTWPPG